MERRLDKGFEPGLFTLRSFRRQGHHPYTVADDDRDHVLIYYSAELELQRNHKLSDWDGLNVGSLTSVLGATAKGIEGVKPAGNHRGDLLRVRGTSAYVRDGNGWVPTAYPQQGGKPAKQGPRVDEPLPYRQHLARLSDLGGALQTLRDPEGIALLTTRLERLAADSERRLGRAKGWWTLATGNPTGEYHRQGLGLERILTRAGRRAKAYATSGSHENCRLVSRREVVFAYAQNDVAHMAYEGSGTFAGEVALKGLRAVVTLYPEAVHVVATRASGIRAVGDLRGKRINIGPRGSGARVNALQVLAAAGVDADQGATLREEGLQDAIGSLRAGRVDALFFTSAWPTPALRELAEQTALTLLSLDPPMVAALAERFPFLIPMTIPRKAYSGVGKAARTVGVTATLVTHAETPNEHVHTLLSELFANVDSLSEGSLQAYLISPDKAQQGLSIPLHPAATAFLRDNRGPGDDEPAALPTR
jgi:TRAP transporter TAXI family solute receptor